MGHVPVNFFFFLSLPRIPQVTAFICSVLEGEHSQHVLKTKIQNHRIIRLEKTFKIRESSC